MLPSGKIQFLFSGFFIAFATTFFMLTSAQKVVRENPSVIMRISEKVDYLTARMDHMKQTAENNAFDEIHEIISNITHAMSNKIKKKFEDKLNKMEELLLLLLNASERERSDESDGGGVWGGVTSHCQSMCQAKLSTWVANHTGSQLATQLQRMELCDTSEPKAANVCEPNPCLYGGRCAISSTGNNYYCICPKRTSGTHCQNVECAVEKRCWRLKDTLYTVIETKLTWAQAKVKCENQNMTLAMPKDLESTRFLWDRLKPIYSYSDQHFLWLGLKRVEGGSGWVWLDGSVLGDFTGGWTRFKGQTGSIFGVLSLVAEGVMWWVLSATNQLYAVCEFHLISH